MVIVQIDSQAMVCPARALFLHRIRSSSRELCLLLLLSPSHVIYFEASHRPSDHMNSRGRHTGLMEIFQSP